MEGTNPLNDYDELSETVDDQVTKVYESSDSSDDISYNENNNNAQT